MFVRFFANNIKINYFNKNEYENINYDLKKYYIQCLKFCCILLNEYFEVLEKYMIYYCLISISNI